MKQHTQHEVNQVYKSIASNGDKQSTTDGGAGITIETWIDKGTEFWTFTIGSDCIMIVNQDTTQVIYTDTP